MADLVPLKERGLYNGLTGMSVLRLFFGTVSIADASLGRGLYPPLLARLLEELWLLVDSGDGCSVGVHRYLDRAKTHRRLYFPADLNLPICGAALVMVTAFLKLPTPPGNLTSKLGRMDWL